MFVKDIGELPQFFDKYILKVDSELILEDALIKHNPEALFLSEMADFERIGDLVYAPGKWTIKQIVQHCIDTERIMSYRALAFARGDKTELPGFDENVYAATAKVNHISKEELISEYKLVRMATICLFKNLQKEDFLRKGKAFVSYISPLSLGFVIVGHPMHHLEVIKERYYSLK
jgi:DinB superfamily